MSRLESIVEHYEARLAIIRDLQRIVETDPEFGVELYHALGDMTSQSSREAIVVNAPAPPPAPPAITPPKPGMTPSDATGSGRNGEHTGARTKTGGGPEPTRSAPKPSTALKPKLSPLTTAPVGTPVIEHPVPYAGKKVHRLPKLPDSLGRAHRTAAVRDHILQQLTTIGDQALLVDLFAERDRPVATDLARADDWFEYVSNGVTAIIRRVGGEGAAREEPAKWGD